MQDQMLEQFFPPMTKAADSIPRRRIFMMGNGKSVQPKTAESFCSMLVDGCLDGEILTHYDFALGFAACFDAVSRGTIDLDENPIDVMRQAWADIENITNTPNKVTDIMRIASEL